jgi:hypothetical protein
VDNAPSHLAYALRRLSRASPSIQHLKLEGLTSVASTQAKNKKEKEKETKL